MLPFMPKKQSVGVSVSHIKRGEEDLMDSPPQDNEEDPALISAAADAMAAFHSKDVKSLALALKAFFEICDSMPHEEGEHLDSL